MTVDSLFFVDLFSIFLQLFLRLEAQKVTHVVPETLAFRNLHLHLPALGRLTVNPFRLLFQICGLLKLCQVQNIAEQPLCCFEFLSLSLAARALTCIRCRPESIEALILALRRLIDAGKLVALSFSLWRFWIEDGLLCFIFLGQLKHGLKVTRPHSFQFVDFQRARGLALVCQSPESTRIWISSVLHSLLAHILWWWGISFGGSYFLNGSYKLRILRLLYQIGKVRH